MLVSYLSVLNKHGFSHLGLALSYSPTHSWPHTPAAYSWIIYSYIVLSLAISSAGMSPVFFTHGCWRISVLRTLSLGCAPINLTYCPFTWLITESIGQTSKRVSKHTNWPWKKIEIHLRACNKQSKSMEAILGLMSRVTAVSSPGLAGWLAGWPGGWVDWWWHWGCEVDSDGAHMRHDCRLFHCFGECLNEWG